MLTTESPDVLILVADDFDDTEVAYCSAELQRANLSTQFVALRNGLVAGAYGMLLRPMRTVVEAQRSASRLVIIPGTRKCAEALLAQPRTHKLLEHMIARNAYVATLSPDALTILSGLGTVVAESSYLLTDERSDTLAFIKRLPNYLL